MEHGNTGSMNMNTGHGMDHMVASSTISWTFALIIFSVCTILVFHIAFTLWRKCNQINRKTEHRNILGHSLSMSLGMISTLTICTVVGALMKSYISASYILGFAIGIIVGYIISSPFKNIAILDGVVAGVMGGLMGVMLGTMIPLTAVYSLSILLVILFAFIWIVLLRRIFNYSAQTEYPTNRDSVSR